MKTLSISKLTEFLKIVEAESDLISTNNSDDLLLFRGQDVDESLLPKNARRLSSIRSMVSRTVMTYTLTS